MKPLPLSIGVAETFGPAFGMNSVFGTELAGAFVDFDPSSAPGLVVEASLVAEERAPEFGTGVDHIAAVEPPVVASFAVVAGFEPE